MDGQSSFVNFHCDAAHKAEGIATASLLVWSVQLCARVCRPCSLESLA